MPRPTPQRCSPARSNVRGGFTMIELLMVIIIISILLALLLPAINSAMKTARKSAVSAEIGQMAQALANFKAKYGDYPPSRFLAVESGNYTALYSSNAQLSSSGTIPDHTQTDPTSPGTYDINLGQLAQRSAIALRKFWPRVNTTAAPTGQFYDFNGNNNNDGMYVLHGHECLVFFLGGVPSVDTAGNFGLTGFSKDPTNPFKNLATDSNRQPPMFEFNPGRLFLDPNTQLAVAVGAFPVPNMPAYYDSLGNASPVPSGLSFNFYAYFSAYGSGGYDPNDVNFAEADSSLSGPIGLHYSVGFPTFLTATTTSNLSYAYAANPYTSTLTISSVATPVVTYLNPQSFQIISSGFDGLYGVGGQFISSAATTATTPLPVDFTSLINTSDPSVRQREADNLTNVKAGSLQ